MAGYALYEWDAAMNGSASFDGENKVQGICPVGWHIPSLPEFDTLISVFGDRSTAGPILKSTGSSGFNDILAGAREQAGEMFFEILVLMEIIGLQINIILMFKLIIFGFLIMIMNLLLIRLTILLGISLSVVLKINFLTICLE
ncbi:hypothetical protein IPN41_03850 [Candidatus Falkowbacteria bacterium]|nr:MAG: hypothetical protein IPN41_03850 [Candidatus Falkowbacteria bacterium]